MVCESSPMLDNKIYNLKLINKLSPVVGGFWTSCLMGSRPQSEEAVGQTTWTERHSIVIGCYF